MLMILGYAIIAVPTGIVTSELTKGQSRRMSDTACPGCGRQGHSIEADRFLLCLRDKSEINLSNY
jgi:voltage-gated potassium channel